MSASGNIRIGLGGWSYQPWRGSFYPDGLPQKRELEYASARLTSIEINSTFYRAPKASTFAGWYAQTPPDFVFSIKAPRYITHRKALPAAEASMKKFLESGLVELQQKLGPINWQFPPTKTFDASEFEAFLDMLPHTLQGLSLRHAVEVRHESFVSAEFVELARKHRVAIVVARDSSHPMIADPTADFVYARLMGTQPGKRHGYAPAQLKKWLATVQAWARGETPANLPYLVEPTRGDAVPRDIYAYVISGHKVANPQAAMALIKLLG